MESIAVVIGIGLIVIITYYIGKVSGRVEYFEDAEAFGIRCPRCTGKLTREPYGIQSTTAQATERPEWQGSEYLRAQEDRMLEPLCTRCGSPYHSVSDCEQ